jgi:hypothetical protein
MKRARNRRSWQIELPHIGDAFAGTCSRRNESAACSTCASVAVDARTLSTRPDRVCVDVFQASIAFSTASS